MDFTKWLCGLVVLLVVGCTPLSMQPFHLASFGFRSDDDEKHDKKKDDDEEGEFSTKVNTPLIGEYTQVGGLNVIVLQGVGLVTGLPGTGGDPPPSMYRTAMLEDMRKRGVKNPNEILRSPNTALVVVRAYLPPLIAKGDHFDVDVRAVDGSEVKSLNGGWLMETHLSEQALVPGRGVLEGHIYATAKGPVLVSMSGSEKERTPLLQRGRVVAGGISKKDRDLTLFLRNDFRSIRNSDRIAKRIGERFFEYNESGQRKPLAEAKTDQRVELKVQSKYKDNFPRYLQVIRSITYRETPVALQVRLRDLKDKLLNPQTAEEAAIKLESVGDKAVPILKAGLQSSSREVRFHSAVALAYLGESDGLSDLAKAVRDEPAFRVFGLAAMAVVEDAESHMHLKELMNESSAETRYGAFRALTTLDKNHPDVRGEPMGDNFQLHILNTTGPPLVHLTNRRKAEVVLFGADQHFKTPFVAYAGLHILATAQAGSDTVTVSRYEVVRNQDEVGNQDQVRTVSTRIADVIRAAVDLGASYPDVAELLAQTGAQQNLPGRIEIDALPSAGRVYTRPAGEVGGATKSQAHVGNPNLVPNLFSAFDETSVTKDKDGKSEDADEKSDKTKSDEAKKDKTDKESKQETQPKHAAKESEAKPSGHEDRSSGDASPKTGKVGKPAKDQAAPPKTASKVDSAEDEATNAESESGWSWNPFRMFRGMGQTEPEIDDQTSSPSGKDAKSKSETASPVGEQREP